MKVIVAGLPKTGTKSLAKALQILGYSVYDTKDNFIQYGDKWLKIMEAGGTAEDFKEMYADIDASLDVPAVKYWEEMLRAFPETKVCFLE